MKKFQSLGRSLTKDEMKNVIGGVIAEQPPCYSDECTSDSDCSSGYTCQTKECSYHTSAKKCVFSKGVE